MRGATRRKWDYMVGPVQFQSTHPMRGATGSRSRSRLPRRFQSTHPMRGATLAPAKGHTPGAISIHAPHAGCDRSATSSSWLRQRFQSTHPMRGATWPSAGISACSKNFNPRTPCGVRPIVKFHALLALGISIHAPHAGCDLVVFSVYICTGNFNPRTPCGVRLIVKQIISAPLKIFQSTHPMRGATLTGGHCF